MLQMNITSEIAFKASPSIVEKVNRTSLKNSSNLPLGKNPCGGSMIGFTRGLNFLKFLSN